MAVSEHVEKLIELALLEDIRSGDVTSEYFVPVEAKAEGYMLVKQAGVVAGYDVVKSVFDKVDSSISLEVLVEEGVYVEKGTRVMKLSGPARSVLTAERVSLNFMQRLSGIASEEDDSWLA